MDHMEFIGKNTEEALAKAQEHFGVPLDRLEVEVLSAGSAGLFGLIGAKKAKVRVRPLAGGREEDLADVMRVVSPAEMKLSTPRLARSRWEATAEPARPDPSAAPAAPAANAAPTAPPREPAANPPAPVASATAPAVLPVLPDPAEAGPAAPWVAAASPAALPAEEPAEETGSPVAAPAIAAQPAAYSPPSPARRLPGEEDGEEPVEGEAGERLETDPALLEMCHEVVVRLVAPLDTSARVKVQSAAQGIMVDVEGEETGVLIGRRGQTLDALQYLTTRIVSHRCSRPVRVVLDAGGYRQRRRDSLEDLALRLAEKAKSTGRSVSMGPLNPQERRVVHMCLRGQSGLSTTSRGRGELKKVIIFPRD
ncbi:MAG: Jag N-terminal domain-containing protein [Deltaproteobacteria bacterium]|nr:Jag N-terminal domain-containing protein [Deltaproteobacteria bacterium]